MRQLEHSAELSSRVRRRVPGGVHSNIRLDGPPIFFGRGEGAWLWDYRDLQRLDLDRYRKLALRLFEVGVWVVARGVWFISAALGDTVVDITMERADGALRAL